jgi:hypothetical protein
MRKLRIRRPSAAMIVALVALSMSIVGTAAAAGVFSHQEKKGIKKIANKQITKKAGNLHVASADVAGNVLAATVNAGDTCAISKQTGNITAALVGTSPGPTAFCDVTFPRSVENCSVGATPLHPLQDISGMASTRYLGGAKVRVTRVNGANNFQAAGLFTIFAICPA